MKPQLSEHLNFKDWKGIVKVDHMDGTICVKTEIFDNLIVNNARIIVRDLLNTAPAGNTLYTLQLGNMGLTYGADTTSLTPPTLTDTALVNSIFTINASSDSTGIIGSSPYITENFTILASQANDSNLANYNNLITELGLFTGNGLMFSRLVVPIVKTRGLGLNIAWTINL
jgi:hypothetical protein